MYDLYQAQIAMLPINWESSNQFFFCNGEEKSSNDNPYDPINNLYSLIGNRFGGDGNSNFAMPDLQDRQPDNIHYFIAWVGYYPLKKHSVPEVGYVGQVLLVAFTETDLPGNFLLCDGSLVDIKDYPDLFKTIGTKFGGNGTTNFALPDLQSETPDEMLYAIVSAGTVPASGGSADSNE